MKKNPFGKITLLLFTLALVLPGSVKAIPTLSVSPSVISNTYEGIITLNITGLTNTEQVVVRRWIDGNANGVIDAGELQVDGFGITDGGAMVINGVTNLNVPFDRNATGGAITTTLNTPPGMVIETMVGHYIFQMVSPTGRFVPVTTTFQVTDTALNQSVSGIIYSNGVPVPYAVVVAQDLQQNNPTGSAMADASGHYFLTLIPGNYAFIASAPNCYFNQNAAPTVTLTNGMLATNDLFLTNGTVTLAGNIYDSANNNGIGGLLLQLQSGPFFGIAFTDANGNYSAAVTPGFWKIKAAKERLARRAYVYPNATFQVDTTAGNVTNANLALSKGNALFYGRITDNLNNPFSNIKIDAGSDNGSGSGFDGKGYSDLNGYYTVAVLGDGTNYWGCSVNDGQNTAILPYVLNTFNSVIISSNQTILQNYIALPAIGTISGHVQDNSGTNVTGVGLYGFANIGGNNYNTLNGFTDNFGNYSLPVAAGQWYVQFLNGNSSTDILDKRGYVDLNTPHIVNVPPTNAVLNMTVYPIGTPTITAPQRFSSTQFGFTINGAMNVSYTVQYSTNLGLTNWANLFSLILTNSVFPVVDSTATNSPRFYRVQKN
jgi:hypothetical protein